MNNELSQLYRLSRKDVKIAAEIFSQAFQTDLLAQYMFPDEEQRKQILPHYFTFRIKYGILYGEVYAPSSNIEGLAVWYHNDKYPMTYWKMFKAGGMKLFMKIDKETMRRRMRISHFSDKLRNENTHFPYWYLAPIGIDPKNQGKGYCSKMIRPMLNRCDKERIATVLETQLDQNVEIYKRYGYEIIAKAILPHTNIPHYLMIRYPAI